MAKHEQTGNPTPGLNIPTADGTDQGHGSPTPQPSASAAAAAGAVGPGALAAEETLADASETPASQQATEAAAGFAPDDIETLRGLAQRAGGVEALIRWLQLHPDLQ
jgi:hypothetical protein